MQDVTSLWTASSTSAQLATALLAAIVLGAIIAATSFRTTTQTEQNEQAQVQKRNFTATEVAEHSQKDSLWIVLNGKVYDVTAYIEEHPGGAAIFRHAGSDATEGFFGPQHPERVFDLIDDFYIGDLVQA